MQDNNMDVMIDELDIVKQGLLQSFKAVTKQLEQNSSSKDMIKLQCTISNALSKLSTEHSSMKRIKELSNEIEKMSRLLEV